MADTNTYAESLGSISVEQVEPVSVNAAWPDCEAAIDAALVAYMPGLLTSADCREMCDCFDASYGR
jgi:hypothetical protein